MGPTACTEPQCLYMGALFYHLNLRTTRSLHTVTYTRGRIDTIDSPDDEHLVARNM